MQLQLEHRRHKRIEISRPVELFGPSDPTDADELIPGSTLNISNNGVAAHFDECLDIGELRSLLMHLEEDAPPVNKQARIVWCQPSSEGPGIDAGLELVNLDTTTPHQPGALEEELRTSSVASHEEADTTPEEDTRDDEPTHTNLLESGQKVELRGQDGDVLTGRILSSQVGKTPGSISVQIQLEPRAEKPAEPLWKRAASVLAALPVLGDLLKRASVVAVDLLRKSPPPTEGSYRLWDKVRLRARGFRKHLWIAAVQTGHKVALFLGKVIGSRRNKRRPFRTPFKD